MASETSVTREFRDESEMEWIAYAEDAVVAHGRPGAILAFRQSGSGADEFLRSTITFNSIAAANFALRTMSDKELRRRLSLARMAAGGV
jgi:hypothetical protein